MKKRKFSTARFVIGEWYHLMVNFNKEHPRLDCAMKEIRRLKREALKELKS